MSARLAELAHRRAALIARAATQRAMLAQAYAPWRGSLAIIDRGWVAVRYIRHHPALLVGMVALAALAVKRGLSGG